MVAMEVHSFLAIYEGKKFFGSSIFAQNYKNKFPQNRLRMDQAQKYNSIATNLS